jgi:hypothetical protein
MLKNYCFMISNEDIILLSILAAGALYMNWNTIQKDFRLLGKKNSATDSAAGSVAQQQGKPAEEAA